MTDLPPSWEWTTLGETCEVVGGSTPKTAVLDYWGGDIPWVTPDDLSRHSTVGIAAGARSLTEEGFRSTSARMLPRGAVLFSSRAPIGYAAIADAPLCTNQGIKSVVPPKEVSSRYLYWYLRHATPLIESMGSGTTFSEISKRRMQEVPIPIAPSQEQKRIIFAIEEHLSRLDAGEFTLGSARRRLVALEQRCLDEAIEGQPTPLRGLLREPLRNGVSAPASPSGSIRVVTLTAVTKSEFIDAHTKMIDPGDRSLDDLWMESGDVFVQRSNTPELVGTVALYDGRRGWAIFPDLLIRVRVDPDLVSPSYLELVLRSTPLRRYFQRSAQGIAGSMPKISQPIVEEAQIPLPSSERQLAIVRRVSEQRTVVHRVSAEATRTVARASSLRRSVLAAAFSGRLVPQDPNDEPASVLLERIRAEQASATPTKRTRKAKAL